MSTARTRPRAAASDPLLRLRNVGPAMRADLSLLVIDTLEQLAACEPDDLYLALQRQTGRRHDPCVWDTFAAAIHQARTGEALDWWTFTPLRKLRQAEGRFVPDPRHPWPPLPGRQNARPCASGSRRSARGRRAG